VLLSREVFIYSQNNPTMHKADKMNGSAQIFTFVKIIAYQKQAQMTSSSVAMTSSPDSNLDYICWHFILKNSKKILFDYDRKHFQIF